MAYNYFRIFVCEFLMLAVFGQESILHYSVPEEVQSGTLLGNVGQDSNLRATASSEDYSHIRYSFLHQGHSYQTLFSINSLNGSVYTNAVLDRENIPDCEYSSSCVLSLNVVAQSKISAFFRKIKLNITILDINDHAPSFSKERTVLKISELATVGSAIALVGAVDADTGNNSLQRYYILDSEVHNLPFATSFEKFVDGTSVVKLEITGNLDRETKDFYNLTIVAEDNGNPKLTGTMEVNILIEDSNDNSPVFTQSPYNVTIEETTGVGTEILRLTATDADLGINSEIVYSLSENQIGKIHDLFVINETSGALCVKSAFTNAAQYRVIVEATDKGLQPLMTQAVVVIKVLDSNNNPPEININLFSDTGIAKISEYADIGTVVAHIGLIDKDTGINGIIQCDISSDHGVFKLQGFDVNEYKVTVAKGLDRETMEFVYVIINCQDKGNPPLNSYVEFSVQITDENDHSPNFLQEIYFVDVYENNDIDTELVQVSAIDSDIGKNGEIQYSAWATGKYQFYIDAMSGFIKTMSTFDRETDDRVTLYVYAKDAGSPPRTGTATVILNILDLNDNDPHFNESLFMLNVSENVPVGTSVGTIVVKDDDTDKNGQISLIIDADLPFTIDSSGVIKTDTQIDREDKHMYNFLVTAYDHGVPSRNSTASVVVHILDENDNYPVFVFPDVANYTIVIPADTQPKTVVAKIKAFDLDENMDSQRRLFYSILNTNVSTVFTIDGNTGEITLVRPILDTDQEIFNIQLKVEDNGNPKLHNTTSLRIFIERLETPKKPSDSGGENMLIAILLGCVTFVLVFTIGLVIVVLRMKSRRNKDDDESDRDRFYDNPNGEKRVQFAEITHQPNDNDFVAKPNSDSLKTVVTDDAIPAKDADLALIPTDDVTVKDDKQVNILFLSFSVYSITKTCLYNSDPLKPHFYIVKLGFSGVYIIFLISAKKKTKIVGTR